MSDPSTGQAIVEAVRASLKLVSSSSELLDTSQLSAVKSDLRETLSIINGQIHLIRTGAKSLVIDMSEWEESSDEEDNPSGKNGDAAGSGVGENETPLPVPGPYPMSPPDMEQLPDRWYVVDRGTEVGIFADNASSTSAVVGVTGGHQTVVKTWHEAATLYNALYHKGKIVRVRA